MHISELFLLALGLSMDAFAVSVSKGLSAGRVEAKHMLACGLYFGFFQALMPVLGYLLGINFQAVIAAVDHWIAFVLLGVIGLNMIREARSEAQDGPGASFAPGEMALLAIATSIDALAVGVTFAFLQVRILPAAACIGLTTCILCMLGAKLGGAFGVKWKQRAEWTGGGILMAMGGKILLEHLFF